MFDLLFPKWWSTLKKLIWLKAAALSSAVVKTVTAAIVHIRDALAGPAQNVTIAIEPVQDLHGYDSPWPAGGGPNFYDGTYTAANKQFLAAGTGVVSYYEGLVNRSIVVPCKAGEKYVIRSGIEGTMRVGSFPAMPATGNTPSVFVTATATSGQTELTITTGASDAYLFVQFFIDSDIQDYGASLSNALNGFYYSLDSNICPISGWTGANVTRTGKNLFPATLPSAAIAGTLSSAGTIVSATNARIFAIPCKANTDLYFSQSTTGNALVVAFSSKAPAVGDTIDYRGNMTNRLEWGLNSGNNTFLLLQISNTSYWDALIAAQIMIEIGTAKTAYEAPSDALTIPITFPTPPGTVYGGTLDVTNGVLTVTHKSVDMGALSWSAAGTRFFSSGLAAEIKIPANNDTVADLLCSVYSAANYSQVYADTVDRSIAVVATPAGSAGQVSARDHSASGKTGAEFKTYVTGQMLVYELATLQTYQLTAHQIDLLLGENNLWSDTGNTTLTYMADGTADDVQALNILLGGRYVNNGGADEADDREALDILLGR